MNEQTPHQRPTFTREERFQRILENASCQATVECRENYLRSCEAHGGESAEVAAEVRNFLIEKDKNPPIPSTNTTTSIQEGLHPETVALLKLSFSA